jgi:hypothetical protein
LRANFRAINNAFADNHVGLTQDNEFSGKHSILTLRTVADPATNATQIAIYNKLVAGIPALFFRPSVNQPPIQMTYPSIKADSSNTQYSFVAGPFIVYGGFLANVTNGQAVNLSPGTNLRSVDLIVANPKIGVQEIAMAAPTNIVGTSFNIEFQPFAPGFKIDIYYFAVGQ